MLPVTTACVLCGSGDFSVEFQLATSDIAKLYRHCTAIDITSEFSGISRVDFCRCRNCDLGFFWPPVTGSSDFYAKLQRKDPQYYQGTKPEYDMGKRFIRPEDKVLEVGSGVGNFSLAIQCESYTGLEFNEQAIDDAQRRGINVIRQSVESHAVEHVDEYDVVCSFQVLEHVSNVREFLSAQSVAVRPGGLLIACVPSEDSYMTTCWNSYYNMPPHHVTRWSDKALANICRVLPLDSVVIEHEQVADGHKLSYLTSLVLRSFGPRFRQRSGIDISFSFRLANKVARALAGRLLLGLDDRMLPHGHSVLAVFRK